MYCMNCGGQLPDDASFCRFCGAAAEQKAAAGAAASHISGGAQPNNMSRQMEGLIIDDSVTKYAGLASKGFHWLKWVFFGFGILFVIVGVAIAILGIQQFSTEMGGFAVMPTVGGCFFGVIGLVIVCVTARSLWKERKQK